MNATTLTSPTTLATVIARAGRIIERRGLDPECWITPEAWRDPKGARVDVRTALMIGLRRPQWEWYGGCRLFSNPAVCAGVDAIASHLISAGLGHPHPYPSVIVARWEQRCDTDQARTALQAAADALQGVTR